MLLRELCDPSIISRSVRRQLSELRIIYAYRNTKWSWKLLRIYHLRLPKQDFHVDRIWPLSRLRQKPNPSLRFEKYFSPNSVKSLNMWKLNRRLGKFLFIFTHLDHITAAGPYLFWGLMIKVWFCIPYSNFTRTCVDYFSPLIY